MKICWDNLEKLKYTKRCNFRDKDSKITYYYKDSCKNCFEPFLTHTKDRVFCCPSCASNGENNNMYGKEHTIKSKKKISENRKNIKVSEKTKRKLSESHKGLFIGENHPNWLGGISDFPYCPGWRQLSQELKEGDGNECKNPLCEGRSQRMTSHHIDYDKQNCRPSNVITLCNSCNVRANSNREWWQNLYIQLKGE